MKYLMTFLTKADCKVTFDYSDSGLVSISFEGEFTDLQKQWVLQHAPPSLGMTQLTEYFQSSKIKIILVDEDLSFQIFWNKYNYKHGNKPRAERLWNALSDADKMLALTKLKKYLYDLANSSIEQAHASTWLHQRRFEN